jgi:dUTPase
MKLGLNTLDGNSKTTVDDNILTFFCERPIVVQPVEIQKVKVAAALQIVKGAVLNISTSKELAERAAEIFPAMIVLDHTFEGELLIPVRNNGRNPLHLMGGQVIARGYLIKVQKIEPHRFELLSEADRIKAKTKPQKKNPNFQFEVK